MSEMVDKVARALAEREGSGPWEGGLLGDRGREMWRITARTAMEAMRHYTFEMEQSCMKAMKDGEPFELVWERAFNIALRP